MTKWTTKELISDRRKTGTTWLVSQNNEGDERKGYLKYPTPESQLYSGPLVANEYISFMLGKEYGVPVADLKLVKVDGEFGIISIRRNVPYLLNWSELSDRYDDVFDHITDPKKLIKMFVFDTWIANIDRNNRNMILYQINAPDLYDFYLIDHGLTLLGSIIWKNVDWNDPYWYDVAHYNRRYLKGLPLYILKHKDYLDVYIDELRNISNRRIRNIIYQIPSYLLGRKQKKVVYSFLTKRKKKLSRIMKGWYIEFCSRFLILYLSHILCQG